MFGATKFVVDGVIAALFVGLLLTGVLTQQSSHRSLTQLRSDRQKAGLQDGADACVAIDGVADPCYGQSVEKDEADHR